MAILNQLGETWKAEEGLKDEDIWPTRGEIDVMPEIPFDTISPDTGSIPEAEMVRDTLQPGS